MHLTFAYEPAKEIDTLRVALGGRQNSSPVPFGIEAQEAGIDTTSVEEVTRFCEEKIAREGIDMNARVKSSQEAWDWVEKAASERFARIFETNLDLGEITAYLTLSQRYPYNYLARYFFVGRNSVEVALHELTHFYTFDLIELLFHKADVHEKFDFFKEALTVLLNLEFRDLMKFEDKGYPQHQELRTWISEKWRIGSTVYEIAEEHIKTLRLPDQRLDNNQSQ